MDHVYQSPGISNTAILLDEASMHPGMNDPPETIQEAIELSDYIFSQRLEQMKKFIEKEINA